MKKRVTSVIYAPTIDEAQFVARTFEEKGLKATIKHLNVPHITKFPDGDVHMYYRITIKA